MNTKQSIIKILKASGKQFYDWEGNPVSVDKFVDILLSLPPEDIIAYQETMQKKYKEAKKDEPTTK